MKEHCTPLDSSLKRSLPNHYFQGCLTLHLHDKLMSNVPLQYHDKRLFLRARDRFSTSNPNINTTHVKERAHGPDLRLWALWNSITGLSQLFLLLELDSKRIKTFFISTHKIIRSRPPCISLRFWSGVTRRGLGAANKHPNSKRPSRVLMSEVGTSPVPGFYWQNTCMAAFYKVYVLKASFSKTFLQIDLFG